MTDKPLGKLTFGFDIGIASVGWCVLDEERIVDLGVRCFDKAETAKEGESLNLARRSARLMRRRLRRRAWRLTKLARLLKRAGLLADVHQMHQATPAIASPWKLRVEGLDRRLSDQEWARVIYHLCKHRGFHWISKAEKKKAEGDKKEGGRVTQGLSDTQRRMTEKSYRSAAEMVLAEFPEAQRNKQGDYGKALSRVLLADELALLFRRQRELGNRHADAGLEAEIFGNDDSKRGLFWEQHPALSGLQMLDRIGRCTFERPGGPDGKGEYRAPKASFTAERHVWLTRLNNLRIVVEGATRGLNTEERCLALPLPYKRAGDFKYEHLRTALTKAGLVAENFKFAGLSYPVGSRADDAKAKDPESERLIKLPAWQELRKVLKDKGLETEWESMAGAATGGDPAMHDEIARVLSVFKEGDEVTAELRKLNLPGGEAMIAALSEISFDKFHALSLKALRKIVPHMEAGLRYDEACLSAGYHHSQLNKAEDEKELYLPPFYEHVRGHKPGEEGKMLFSERIDREVSGGIPRNPVVLRALNQARKVLNALVRTYGSPAAVHIEMARDLSRPFDERNKVKKAQDEYRERNEKDKATFAAEYGIAAKSREFEKFQLYREQQAKCVYCQLPLEPNGVVHKIFEPGATEVDHALPYSRSFDDSKNNKVLVHSKCNRDKGNRTAYEYLTSFPGGEDGERWRGFATFVETNKSYRLAKKTRLLRKDFNGKAADEFRERNLNDTRYICRFFKNYVERYLKLADASEGMRCVVLSGQLTSFLRARWGLLKERAANDRHHALDAAVVAACSHSMVQRLADYSRRKELHNARDGLVNLGTGVIANSAMFEQLRQHFPEPWPHFRNELKARLEIDDPTELRSVLEVLGTYPRDALTAMRPLFVSRAPQRRNGGALHQETIRSSKKIDEGISSVKVPIQKLKLADIDRIVGATDPRNSALIALLRQRLETHGDDGKKAFANVVHKPSALGRAPLVRTVKLAATQKGGMRLRGGVADLGEMHHVDVYRHRNRFLMEPAYAVSEAQRVKGANLPPDAEFLFTLTKNDFVKVTLGNAIHNGYFVMYESDGRLTLRAHDQPKPDKEYFRKGIASASRIEKFHIDVLGNIYPAPQEPRHGLA